MMTSAPPISGCTPSVLHVDRQVPPPDNMTIHRFGPAALETAAMFGMNLDALRTDAILDSCAIALPPGGIVFVTGPSGGGKSTLLRAVAKAARAEDREVITSDPSESDASDRAIVDLLADSDSTCDRAHRLLTLAGLGEARLMLQLPNELSEGQRVRFALARAFDRAERAGVDSIILLDEFCSVLDRMTARNIARMVRRWMNRMQSNRTIMLATAHDDLLESLEPEALVLVECGGGIQIHRRPGP